MNGNLARGIHWSFWVISAITLVFNFMGAINFIVQMDPESLASFPARYRPIIEGRPVWAAAAFAVAVLGGALGCLLLLFKQGAAFGVFLVSLVGVLVSMAHIYTVVGVGAVETWAGVLVQLVVTVFLVWYSSFAKSKGWVASRRIADAT